MCWCVLIELRGNFNAPGCSSSLCLFSIYCGELIILVFGFLVFGVDNYREKLHNTHDIRLFSIILTSIGFSLFCYVFSVIDPVWSYIGRSKLWYLWVYFRNDCCDYSPVVWPRNRAFWYSRKVERKRLTYCILYCGTSHHWLRWRLANQPRIVAETFENVVVP